MVVNEENDPERIRTVANHTGQGEIPNKQKRVIGNKLAHEGKRWGSRLPSNSVGARRMGVPVSWTVAEFPRE